LGVVECTRYKPPCANLCPRYVNGLQENLKG